MTDTDTTHSSGYDSRPATLMHSLRVGELMGELIVQMLPRSYRHDLSKTLPPEVEAFDRMTPQLPGLTYCTPEYAASLADLGPALEHHYAHNEHHPEHWPNGVTGMSLVDLVEMIADWKASTERMGGTGDLRASIKHNIDRFNLTPQLAQILINTAERAGWIPPAGE